MPAFKTVRGMRDFLPEETERMNCVQRATRELAQLYGYEEVITPLVEYYDLLAAKAGEEIRERMYAFNDMSGRKVALRPEFTASMARLVATKMMNRPKPLKLFCLGSLYRYDEPQYGRYREFWQANYELMGSDKPEADAEILMLTYDLMERLGFRSYYFKIGHMGVLRGILGQEGVKEEQQNRVMQLIDKKRWDEAAELARELGVSQKGLTTLKRIFETKGKDALRVLKETKEIVQDYEGAVASVENLREIFELTQSSSAKFEVLVDAGFARGLEYYTGIVFESYVPEMEIALSGGGRYDRLIELFGGEPTSAVGVAQGVDRIALAMKKQRVFSKLKKEKLVVVIPVSGKMRVKAMEVSLMLRGAGIPAEVEVMGRTVSRALSDADRRGVTHAVIVGPEEAKEGKVVLRDMKKRKQKSINIQDALEEILGEQG
jgi:histidyl-tRNA synthetase